MGWKNFNDGDDAPRFIPAGKEPVDFIPSGHEDEYIEDHQGDSWKKEDWKRMAI